MINSFRSAGLHFWFGESFRRVSREKFKGDDLTWNRYMKHRFIRSDWRTYFLVPSWDHVRTRIEARRAGCETVSVTDSLRPPDRLAQRASFQNDLSIVHTGKKSDESPNRRCLGSFRRRAWTMCCQKIPSRCLKLFLLLLRLVSYRFIPCRSLRAISIA